MFTLTSTAFQDGQEMPQRYGKKSQNLSPPLSWRGAPEETRSFALALIDRHPVARGYVHWLVTDINPLVTSLPEGAADRAMPAGAKEVKPYAGPFPPSGTHDYEFTLYALKKATLGLPTKATADEFRQAVEQDFLATATLVGKFTTT